MCICMGENPLPLGAMRFCMPWPAVLHYLIESMVTVGYVDVCPPVTFMMHGCIISVEFAIIK